MQLLDTKEQQKIVDAIVEGLSEFVEAEGGR